jgi:large subunit ribosomal protein L25
MSFTFTVEKREGKVKDDSLAMGVASGPKQESIPVQFDRKAFTKLYSEAGATNIVALEGLGEEMEVTIKKIDRAPFTNDIHHVEFFVLERGVEMTADVPLVAVNEPTVSQQDGIVNQIVQTVNISCRPRDLIQEIELDMSLLKEVGDTVTVADLEVPKGITINLEPDTALVSVSAVKDEPEPEPEEIPDAADVPVAGDEGKSDETTEAEDKE